MRRWRNPYAGQAWAKCQWCGQAYPASMVLYNPRFGWQCIYDWDGLIQRDQIQQPIFPGEGTRRTPAPIVNSLTEGIAPGSLNQTYIYPIRDRATGQIWNTQFVPLHIDAQGNITYDGPDVITLTAGTPPYLIGPFDGVRINNGWAILVVNGGLATQQPPLDAIGILDGACDFSGFTIPSNAVLLRDITLPATYYWAAFGQFIQYSGATPRPDQTFFDGITASPSGGVWFTNGFQQADTTFPGAVGSTTPPPSGSLAFVNGFLQYTPAP